MRFNGRRGPALLAFAAALSVSLPSHATDAPYEARLMRLGEVLGSLHYLRNLCGDTGNQWREQMEALIAAENPPADKRARYVASFNRGYRSFAASHATCTAATTEAIDRYMKEGEALARDTAGMFGN